MAARRRASPGVTAPASVPRRSGDYAGRLFRFLCGGLGGLGRYQQFARRRRGLRALVFGPVLAQLLALRRRPLGELLVGLACLAPLLRRELGPGLHALLHALLFLRLHGRVALGDADPLELALALDAVPVRLERGEDLLLVGGELAPGRPRDGGLGRRLRLRLGRRL